VHLEGQVEHEGGWHHHQVHGCFLVEHIVGKAPIHVQLIGEDVDGGVVELQGSGKREGGGRDEQG
jgi:hypothetical protein